MSLTEAARPGASPRLGLLGQPDFLRLWLVGLVAFTVRWLETLAVAVFTYERTHSAFIVAMMTMLRLLPMGLFGAWMGDAAERMQRRTALIVVVAALLATSAALAALAIAGRLEVWHLAVGSFVNGVAWTSDNPVRRMMIGEVVGPARMGAAMSVDVGTNNASRMLGPGLGGALMAGVGIHGVFLCSVALYALALLAAFRLHYRNAAGGGATGEGLLARIASGFAFARRDRRLAGILTVTIIYNLFGWPFTSMVPVIAHDALHLGPRGIGLLASLDGVGALLGAVLVALWARPVRHASVYVGGVASYLVLLIAFALLPQAWMAGTALLLTGMGGAGFSIMQATLVFLAAPPEMRSRMMGVLSVCIGVGPLGFIQLGLLADALGAPWATALMGLEGLLALAATWRLWRVI